MKNSAPAKVLKLQLALGLSVMFISAVWAGKQAAASAFLGSACAFVPNAWFVWRLFYSLKTATSETKILGFFVGEIVKVVLTVLLMWLAVMVFKALVWPAFLAALILTLKAPLLVLIFRKTV